MKAIPDFKEEPERQAWIIAHAEYFTVIRRIRKSYERYEYPTLEKAEEEARRLVDKTGGRFMLYAVAGVYSTYVKTVASEEKPLSEVKNGSSPC